MIVQYRYKEEPIQLVKKKNLHYIASVQLGATIFLVKNLSFFRYRTFTLQDLAELHRMLAGNRQF